MTPDVLQLSRREREVLRLLALGHTNREVAARLHISVRTAEWHRASIRSKLDLTSRSDLVRVGLASGLVGRVDGVENGEPAA